VALKSLVELTALVARAVLRRKMGFESASAQVVPHWETGFESAVAPAQLTPALRKNHLRRPSHPSHPMRLRLPVVFAG